jgi:hypothetical protein
MTTTSTDSAAPSFQQFNIAARMFFDLIKATKDYDMRYGVRDMRAIEVLTAIPMEVVDDAVNFGRLLEAYADLREAHSTFLRRTEDVGSVEVRMHVHDTLVGRRYETMMSYFSQSVASSWSSHVAGWQAATGKTIDRKNS